MSDDILTSRDGDVVTIVMNRPDVGNLLGIEAIRALTAEIRQAAASDAKAIVLRGAGDDFCRGRDPRAGAGETNAHLLRTTVLEPILDAYAAIEAAPQPVIAVVQGAAHAFGAALTASSDIAIAADTARFALPEMARDLPPTLAMSALAPRVNRKVLGLMVLALQELTAEEAMRAGLVSLVAPERELAATLARVLDVVTARATPSLVAVKDFLRVAYGMEPRALSDYAANSLATILSSKAVLSSKTKT